MTRRTTTFTLDSQLLEKFQKQVDHGKRSETINELIKKYVEAGDANTKTGVQKQIQQKKSEIEKVEKQITQLKSKKSNLENDIDLLKKRKQEIDNLETKKQILESFFQDQKEKMDRKNIDLQEFKNQYGSGVFDLFSKKYDFNIDRHDFWSSFEKYVEDDVIELD